MISSEGARSLACPLLDFGLNLSHDRLQPCCPDARYTRPEIPYEGGPFPFEAFLELRRRTREEIRNGSSPCLRCPSLVESAEAPAEEGLFRIITLNHFRACNGRCAYCDFWRPEKAALYRQRYSALPVLERLAGEGRISDNATVSWGGGEPTLLAEFDELMGLIARRNLESMVNTNALRFSPALAAALPGKSRMQVSLDSGTPETFRRMKGLDRFEAVVENLRLYARSNANNLLLKYIVASGNAETRDLLGFLDVVVSLGVPRIVISPEASEIRLGRIPEPSLDGAARLWREAEARGLSVTILEQMYGERAVAWIRPPRPRREKGASGRLMGILRRLVRSG